MVPSIDSERSDRRDVPSPVVEFARGQRSHPPLRTQRPEVPVALEAAVTKAPAKEPGKRFMDAGELKRALED